MAALLFERLRHPVGQTHPISELAMVAGSGGIFDVEVDGQVVFSKDQAGRHADPDEVLRAIQMRNR